MSSRSSRSRGSSGRGWSIGLLGARFLCRSCSRAFCLRASRRSRGVPFEGLLTALSRSFSSSESGAGVNFHSRVSLFFRSGQGTSDLGRVGCLGRDTKVVRR